jgi:hypothetical protein
MYQIREIQKLIQNTDFGIEVLDIYCNGFELNFNTAVTKTGVCLRFEINGDTVDDEQIVIVSEKLVYNNKTMPVFEDKYTNATVTEIMRDISNIISRLVGLDTDLENGFKDFEEHSIPRSTKAWKEEFIGELKDLFGSPRTVILASGIKLIIAFEEETNLIKAVLSKGLFFNDEKTLLHGIVSETNYKEVLDIVENIYNGFRYRFYDVDGIVEELKYLHH